MVRNIFNVNGVPPSTSYKLSFELDNFVYLMKARKNRLKYRLEVICKKKVLHQSYMMPVFWGGGGVHIVVWVN